ncbi:MAG: helix-turn-helix domain-containing protein, partial [Acidiferrobacterales bacterium]
MSEITRTPPVAAGPGKRLYEARVRARLSPEQVAEMLHLSTWQITALEKDDFESLPGPTYVRGYLRNYAQLLGLPADEIIASYAGINGTYRSARLDALAPEPEVTTRDGAVRFATFLVGCILILLAVVWWQGRGDRPGTDSDAPPVTAQGEAVQSQAAGEQSFIQAETSVAPESGASSTTSRASTPTAAAVAAGPAAPAAAGAGG